MSGGFMSSLFRKKTDEEEPTKFGLARVFKYEELKRATNSFTTELGIGGFGTVYLGTLRDGKMVAVKVLHNHNRKRLQEFVNEVIVLSRLRHKNLVTLHGCTNPRRKELLLVYEYVPNSTVEDHLHGQRSDLTLPARVQIAVETAEALVYLHALDPPLIHRDVKTSNIMLDHAFHVKVGDLGMCRLLPWDTTQVSTVPQGTMGYRDPEYDRTFILTVKSDVYSFGVVLVELISGKKAVDVNRAPDNIYLAGLALNKITNNKLDDFVDPNLRYNSNIGLQRVINSLAELAGRCLHSTGIMRPTMKQVLTELQQISDEWQQIGGLNVPLQELGDDTLIVGEGESALRCKARLERHQRTMERAAKALAEKNTRDILAQREQAERNRLAEMLDADVRRWSTGKEGNLRALLTTLQYILGPESGWQPIPLIDLITAAAVKKGYRKATLCVHPDTLQQRGANIQQKYICEKVFDLLKDAWNRFNSEER